MERMEFWSLIPLPLENVFIKSCNLGRFIKPSLPWLSLSLSPSPALGMQRMFPVLLGWELFEHNNSHSFSCSALLAVLGLVSGVIRGIFERKVDTKPSQLSSSAAAKCRKQPNLWLWRCVRGVFPAGSCVWKCNNAPLGSVRPTKELTQLWAELLTSVCSFLGWNWEFWVVSDTFSCHEECVLGIIWGKVRKGRWGGTGLQPSMCPQLSWLLWELLARWGHFKLRFSLLLMMKTG